MGLQTLSKEEFGECDKILLSFSVLVHQSITYNRRGRAYRLNQLLDVCGLTIPKIEIFEPWPDTDFTKLTGGFKHIAFCIQNFNDFLVDCQKKNMPIEKMGEFNGSKFFRLKTIR